MGPCPGTADGLRVRQPTGKMPVLRKTKMNRTLFTTVALLFCLPSWALAADWPQFRGPTGQGVSEAKNVPVEWGPEKNVAWKAAIPGRGWSSPVLQKGRLYLTSAVDDADGVTLRAICLEAETGDVVWDVEVFRPDPAAARAMHGKNSGASATPIITDDRLYVHFGHLGTAALDLSGQVLWRQTEIGYSPVHGNGGSPALVGNQLIFSCDGAQDPFVIALDAGTGDIVWKTPRNTPSNRTFSFSTPLAIDVDGETQVVLPGSGLVAAYDPDDGAEIWRVLYGGGYSVVPRPVFAHGLVFVSSGFDQPVVYAIDPKGAKGDVTKKNVNWTSRRGGPNTPSMIVVGDELYFVSDGGVASCVNAETGKPHWTERLGGGFSASPVAAEGRVYFQNEEGVGFVVKAGPKFELLAENDLAERSLASYAVTNGALFIRTESHLWKIHKP